MALEGDGRGAGQARHFAVAPFDLNGVSVLRGSMAPSICHQPSVDAYAAGSAGQGAARDEAHGPVMFVSACVHGDGSSASRSSGRLLSRISPKRLSGTLLLVPVVNVLGFIMHQRCRIDVISIAAFGYLWGSLAGQLAHAFSVRSSVAVSWASISIRRRCTGQSAADQDQLERPAAFELAMAFGAPAVISAPLRLRFAAADGGGNGCRCAGLRVGRPAFR